MGHAQRRRNGNGHPGRCLPNRTGLLTGAFTVLLSMLISGCAGAATSTAKSSSAPAAAPSPIDCGDPTAVVLDETPVHTPWAMAGPFRFATYDVHPRPSKVVIRPEKPLVTAVTLRGWRCSDGHPLRFWYRTTGGYPSVVDARAMETVGDLAATLEPAGHDSIPIDYGGYMLFTTPGKWKVSVFQGDQLVASVVFLVS